VVQSADDLLDQEAKILLKKLFAMLTEKCEKPCSAAPPSSSTELGCNQQNVACFALS
jgi:hypothetical protein